MLDQLAADGQPQAGAAEAPGGRAVGLREGLEQARQRVGADADAGIAHPAVQLDVPGVLRGDFHAHRDLAAVGELDRVAAQVDQHLAQPRRVADQAPRQLGRGAEQQLQALLVGALRQHVGHRVDDRIEFEVDLLQLELAGFDLRHVEDVVQDLQQVARRLVRLVDIVALARRQAVFERQVGHADDRVHRGAQLVRHVGEKAGLGAVRRLGDVAGALQRRLRLLAQGHVLDHRAVVRHAQPFERDHAHHGVEEAAVLAAKAPLGGLHPLVRTFVPAHEFQRAFPARPAVGLLVGGQAGEPQHPAEQGALVGQPEQRQRGRVAVGDAAPRVEEDVAARRVLEHRVEPAFGLAPGRDVEPVAVVDGHAFGMRLRCAVGQQPVRVRGVAHAELGRLDRRPHGALARQPPSKAGVGVEARAAHAKQRFGLTPEVGEAPGVGVAAGLEAEHGQRQRLRHVQQFAPRFLRRDQRALAPPQPPQQQAAGQPERDRPGQRPGEKLRVDAHRRQHPDLERLLGQRGGPHRMLDAVDPHRVDRAGSAAVAARLPGQSRRHFAVEPHPCSVGARRALGQADQPGVAAVAEHDQPVVVGDQHLAGVGVAEQPVQHLRRLAQHRHPDRHAVVEDAGREGNADGAADPPAHELHRGALRHGLRHIVAVAQVVRQLERPGRAPAPPQRHQVAVPIEQQRGGQVEVEDEAVEQAVHRLHLGHARQRLVVADSLCTRRAGQVGQGQRRKQRVDRRLACEVGRQRRQLAQREPERVAQRSHAQRGGGVDVAALFERVVARHPGRQRHQQHAPQRGGNPERARPPRCPGRRRGRCHGALRGAQLSSGR